MNLAEYKGVYVFAQQVDNQISSIALELIGKGKDLAKDLGTTVTAVLVGSNVKGLTELSRILMRSHLLSTSSSRTSS